jgi:hypothetical protein
MSEALVRDRVRPQPGIRAILDAPPAEPTWDGPEGWEDAGGLETFSPESTAYQAHARPGNKLLPSIHFILRGHAIRTCQYMHLESDSHFTPLPQGQGQRLAFRFAGSVAVAVVIEGRNLWRLYDYITQHRIAWVHELPEGRDFEGERAAVIRSIMFEVSESGA